MNYWDNIWEHKYNVFHCNWRVEKLGYPGNIKIVNVTPMDIYGIIQHDSDKVLRYMASNGLVANPKKTAFLIVNGKKVDPNFSIRIGDESVQRVSSACLLGINFQDNLQWQSQIYGKGGLILALNSRLYIIGRLQSHLSKKAVLKVVDGLFTSKIRYGLQLYGKVRTCTTDPECTDFKAIQIIQNNLMRSLVGKKIKDKVSISTLMMTLNMLSVNQLNASVKLLEIWKALNVDDYPLKVQRQSRDDSRVSTRADSVKKPVEIGKTPVVQKTCVSDAIRIWNMAPDIITTCSSLSVAKSEIKKFARQLPI